MNHETSTYYLVTLGFHHAHKNVHLLYAQINKIQYFSGVLPHFDFLLLQLPGYLHVLELLLTEIELRQPLRGLAQSVLHF